MQAALFMRRRDVRAIGLVGTGHFVSHFYQMALPPLFIAMHADMGLSFARLGLLLTLFYATSAIFQTPAGFLVDRIGARRVLLIGLGVMVVAFLGLALAPVYWMMAVFALLAGFGNSVFHPADYSLLSANVGEARMGRAFSLHHVGGFIGYGTAPIVMVAIAEQYGWRPALLCAVVVGAAVFAMLLLASGDFRDEQGDPDFQLWPMIRQSVGILARVPILLAFVFLMMLGMGQIGLQTFTPTVLQDVFGLDLKVAGSVLLAMFIAVPTGIIIGGFVAERAARHELVTLLFYTIAAAAMIAIGLFDVALPVLFLFYVIAGFTYGMASPSRDMVIRAASPRGAAGRVFGFVYSGLDFGSMVTPALFGLFVDLGLPRAMFFVVATLWLLSILCILGAREMTRRAASAPAAAE